MHTYDRNNAAAFCRTREQYGLLSNMAPMPVYANNMQFQSSEGLYQALKFPYNMEMQKQIANAHNGMSAKIISREQQIPIPTNWEQLKAEAMRLTIAQKFIQHSDTLIPILESTNNKPIVELSVRDTYWGAKPQHNLLIGHNVLGRLYTLLRDYLYTTNWKPIPALEQYLNNIYTTFVINQQPYNKESVLTYSLHTPDINEAKER